MQITSVVAFAAWEGFGNLVNKPYVYSYPVTTAGCNITDENLLANISSPVYDPSTWNPQSHYRYKTKFHSSIIESVQKKNSNLC